jgi:hypothetical protein
VLAAPHRQHGAEIAHGASLTNPSGSAFFICSTAAASLVASGSLPKPVRPFSADANPFTVVSQSWSCVLTSPPPASTPVSIICTL